MNEQTIISGLARLEALLVNEGPKVATAIGAVADALSGPVETRTEGTADDPMATHLGTRLHAFADMFEGLLGVIGGHVARAGAVVGMNG